MRARGGAWVWSPACRARRNGRSLDAAGLPLPEGWPLSAVGRAALLARICELLPPEEHVAAVAGQFRTGDNAEREAVLHALPLLPKAERFVDLAIEACRTHVQSVFEAIACENPYPARFFPELNFNQLVLKAFFTGVSARRIEGLSERRTAELIRMAQCLRQRTARGGPPRAGRSGFDIDVLADLRRYPDLEAPNLHAVDASDRLILDEAAPALAEASGRTASSSSAITTAR